MKYLTVRSSCTRLLAIIYNIYIKVSAELKLFRTIRRNSFIKTKEQVSSFTIHLNILGSRPFTLKVNILSLIQVLNEEIK